MCERVKLFTKFLRFGQSFPCNIYTQLIFEYPEQVLSAIKSVDNCVSLAKRQLCNCYAPSELDCDCLPMPLLNHFVYIVSSFGRHFDLAKQIMDALIDHGCDVNAIDADIGTVLHSIICCIDSDMRMSATADERQLSIDCLDYLLSLNKCDFDIDVGCDRFCRASGTPLTLAVEKQLTPVVLKLINAGVSLSKSILRESIIPDIMNEKHVLIYDLLYLAGYQFANDLLVSKMAITRIDESSEEQSSVKFIDWIHEKKCRPMNLKCLARIVVRDALSTRISESNLNNCLHLPQSLILFIQFADQNNAIVLK